MRLQHSKLCIICGSKDNLTREHRIKASLLEFFNDIENKSPDKALLFEDGTQMGSLFTSIRKANNLKPKKNICAKCNNERSTDCDMYIDVVIKTLYEWKNLNLHLISVKSPSNDAVKEYAKTFRSNLQAPLKDIFWNEMIVWVNARYLISDRYIINEHQFEDRLIKKYLAKHAICYFDRSEVPVSDKLRAIFLEGTNLENLNYDLVILPEDFHHGYLNTAIRYPENRIEFAIIYSNIAIHVSILK